MNNKYTEYINNNTFGNDFWWDNDECEKSVSNSKGRQFIFNDELVDVKPKIKETIDYMNPRNWFCEMSGVTPTGSSSDQRMRDIKRQRTI